MILFNWGDEEGHDGISLRVHLYFLDTRLGGSLLRLPALLGIRLALGLSLSLDAALCLGLRLGRLLPGRLLGGGGILACGGTNLRGVSLGG